MKLYEGGGWKISLLWQYYWRANEASETLSGETQLKIIFVYIYVICGDVRMSFVLLTFACFCVSSVVDPVPNFTKQNPLVYQLLPVSP